MSSDPPRWREDFPVEWERDHYVTRRELAKFLVLGSAFLAGASVVIAALGRAARRAGTVLRLRIARASEVPTGGSLLFRYPSKEDPCILVRTGDGTLRAYSQVCTHLSCAVVYRPEAEGFYCPCHHGWFSATDGRPTAGPPTRPLPRVRLEQDGDEVYAVDEEI
jgi:nitrite reductase/ring-hydroxylating ferredoxin subunit